MAAPGIDPTTTTEETSAAAAPEPAAPAAPQPGPWSSDLEQYFQDEAARTAADRYMREKVQPRMTQLETETAPARELYNDLLQDPAQTLADLVTEVFGEDVGQKFTGLFGEETSAAPETPAEPAAEIPDWAKPIVEERERAKAEAEYNAALEQFKAAHQDLTDDDMELIHPFITATAGDLDAAYQGYSAWKERFTAAHGVTPQVDPTPARTAPPVLGNQAAPAAAPPVEKNYKSIDEAMDDWFAEQKSAPPVVGSV